MRRREFIAAVGSAALSWPFAARAQQRGGMRRVAVLQVGIGENDEEGQRRIRTFLQQLKELGWADGHNVTIDFRWAGADADRMRTYVTELLALKPDVMLLNGGLVLSFVLQQTRTVPIVFTNTSDPVGSGFVASLAHPGGNVTGFAGAEFSVFGKLLATLKELAPVINRTEVLHTGQSDNVGMLHAVEAVGPSLGISVTAAEVHDAEAIQRTIEAVAGQPNGSVVVTPNLITQRHRGLIFELATRYKLPAAYPYRNFVADGGLVSYGPDPADPYRGAAFYVDRILKGEKAADLPVQQPSKYELVVNRKAAKSIDLSIPESFLARADEVIE